jgi:hypothetical protein
MSARPSIELVTDIDPLRALAMSAPRFVRQLDRLQNKGKPACPPLTLFTEQLYVVAANVTT